MSASQLTKRCPEGNCSPLLAVEAEAVGFVTQDVSGLLAVAYLPDDLDLDVAPLSRVIEALAVLIYGVDSDVTFRSPSMALVTLGAGGEAG